MTECTRSWILGVAREPLVQFFMAGLVVYGVFVATGRDADDTADTRTITVTAGEIGWMTESWQKRWMRPPTPEELEGLIDQYVRETVLYREAIAMGLDDDDTVVRRRLAQKLEFLSQDLIRPQPPTEDDLRAYFDANVEHYRPSTVTTFSHVFFDPDQRGDRTLIDAEAVKVELAARDDPMADGRAYGDRFMLQSYHPGRTGAEIAKLFGREFARSLSELTPQRWHGPVLSGYGTHLVYVHQRQEAEPPAFAQVEGQVRTDWLEEKQNALNEQFAESLMARYTVIVEDAGADEEDVALNGQSQ